MFWDFLKGLEVIMNNRKQLEGVRHCERDDKIWSKSHFEPNGAKLLICGKKYDFSESSTFLKRFR